jgi:diguanylate cyclase (GGDEF)-like protein
MSSVTSENQPLVPAEDPVTSATQPTDLEEDRVLARIVAQPFPDGIVMLRNGRIVFANAEALRLFGVVRLAELQERPLTERMHEESRPALLRLLATQPQVEATSVDLSTLFPPLEPLKIPSLCPSSGDGVVEVEADAAGFMDQGDTLLLLSLRNLATRNSKDQEIRHQAHYDPLTGLPNRALFMDRLAHELVRAQRRKSRVALMFIDLDRFKWVNDTLGHAAGDQLLKEVGQRLLSCFRKSDTVARLGGDEFTVILPDMAKGPYAERVAREILTHLEQVFILGGQEAYISGSIGITIFPDDASDVDGLIKNADSAMYKAKRDGRNAYNFFTPDMHLEAMERVELESDLRRALEREQFVIHYQPIFDLVDRRVQGAESFLRWHHPTRGFVPPNVFVAVAEETGLIGLLTEWALHTVCRQVATWRKSHPDLFVSVNLSCKRCRELSTDGTIKSILEASGLPPEALKLEITETILSEDETKAMSMLSHLKRMGVSMWLDDFGTGTSSLSVLKRLPLDGIKIDRAFVQDIDLNPDATVLVEAILSLAKSLDLEVIGEGVETESQRQHLMTRGCRLAQGYLFGKPVPHEVFTAQWLMTQASRIQHPEIRL